MGEEIFLLQGLINISKDIDLVLKLCINCLLVDSCKQPSRKVVLICIYIILIILLEMTLALIQMLIKTNKQENLNHAAELIHEAVKNGSTIVALPVSEL